MADRNAVLDRHDELVDNRRIEEKAWQEIAHFLRPDDTSFEPSAPTSTRDDADVLDSSPLYANDEFANGVFAQMSNPANRWFELGVADQELNRAGVIREWCWAAANVLYASLAPTNASFYSQVPATFADMGAFGWGVLSQEEIVRERRICDSSIPISQAYIDVNAEGLVDTFHNAFRWTGRQVRQFFRDRAPTYLDDRRQYLLIHAIYENPDYDPEKLSYQYMRYGACYVSPDIVDLKVEGGYRQMPYHVIGWSRRAGRAYPRGPGHNARADMSTLNEIERTDLVASQFAAEPPLLLHDEDVASAADIVPNNVIYGAVTEQGKALAQYLERQSQLNPTAQKLEQKRLAISTAFRF